MDDAESDIEDLEMHGVDLDRLLPRGEMASVPAAPDEDSPIGIDFEALDKVTFAVRNVAAKDLLNDPLDGLDRLVPHVSSSSSSAVERSVEQPVPSTASFVDLTLPEDTRLSDDRVLHRRFHVGVPPGLQHQRSDRKTFSSLAVPSLHWRLRPCVRRREGSWRDSGRVRAFQ